MFSRRTLRNAAVCTGVSAAAFGAWYYATSSDLAYALRMGDIPEKLNLTYKPQKFPLLEVEDASHDTKIFTFGLGPNQTFHLDAAQTLQVSVFDYQLGKRISRHYTPISPNNTQGKFQVMIKKYENGFMTPKLHSLPVGDAMEWSKVPPAFVYRRGMYDHMYMIAGGVGITPMLQLMRTVLADPKDTTKMSLLFANKSTKDILLKNELDELAKKHPDRIKVTYTIDKPEPGWTGEIGHANKAMITRALTGVPKDGDHIFVCGPDGMMNALAGLPPAVMQYWSGKQKFQPTFQGVNNLGPVMGVLGDMGWTSENTWRF